MKLFLVSLVVALISVSCSTGNTVTGPSLPPNLVAQSQSIQTLYPYDPVMGGAGLAAGVGGGSPRVYTMSIKVRESGNYLVLLAADRMMPDRSNVRFASEEVTLKGGQNTITIADPTGEATYITLMNRSTAPFTVEGYTVTYTPM